MRQLRNDLQRRRLHHIDLVLPEDEQLTRREKRLRIRPRRECHSPSAVLRRTFPGKGHSNRRSALQDEPRIGTARYASLRKGLPVGRFQRAVRKMHRRQNAMPLVLVRITGVAVQKEVRFDRDTLVLKSIEKQFSRILGRKPQRHWGAFAGQKLFLFAVRAVQALAPFAAECLRLIQHFRNERKTDAKILLQQRDLAFRIRAAEDIGEAPFSPAFVPDERRNTVQSFVRGKFIVRVLCRDLPAAEKHEPYRLAVKYVEIQDRRIRRAGNAPHGLVRPFRVRLGKVVHTGEPPRRK